MTSALLRLMLLAVVASLFLGCDAVSEESALRPTPTPPPLRPREPVSLSGAAREHTPEDPGIPEVPPRFTNVATQAGIDFRFFSDTLPGRYFLPEVMGGGAAWIDFDRDGWLDLYVMNGCPLESAAAPDGSHRNRLYRNHAGRRFAAVEDPAGAGHSGYGQGCAVGDFNSDGFPDLFLTNYGPNALLVNNGDGTFTDLSAECGLADPRWGTGAAWVDLDSDGDEDLFVSNYLDVTLQNRKICLYNDVPGYCGPGEYAGVADLAYVNQGDGTFVESSRALGFTETGGKGLAVIATDLNGDQRPDLYIANDMTANFLYTDAAPPGDDSIPAFRNIAASAGCAVSDEGLNEASMGIACADFDNDGLNDLFLSHYYQMKNTLYRNLGGFLFEDESRRSQIAVTSYSFLGFGASPLDYDLDGRPDLFIANGHVLGPGHEPNAMKPQLIHNEGGLTFRDVSDFAGEYFHQTWLGRGVAAADFDNDGDTDLAVTHLERPLALLRNDTEAGRHFLGIDLNAAERSRPVGARVVVRADGRELTAVAASGGSYLSESDPRLLFGLGDAELAREVEVHWPSGRVDRFENLPADRYWRLREGEEPEVSR